MQSVPTPMVPITALVGKDTLGMENHVKVNNLPIHQKYYKFVNNLCSEIRMNGTIVAMFAMSMRILLKLLGVIIIAPVRKGKQSCKGVVRHSKGDKI